MIVTAGEYHPIFILQQHAESSWVVFVVRAKGGAGNDFATGNQGI
jgi:hypothetical protein